LEGGISDASARRSSKLESRCGMIDDINFSVCC
jgi:hypothetical protein